MPKFPYFTRGFKNRIAVVATVSEPSDASIKIGDIIKFGPYQWMVLAKEGNTTYDKVFLLSIEESKSYFKSKSARKIDKKRWWLRSPGSKNYTAAQVDWNGVVDIWGETVDEHIWGVRPAMWIQIES